MTHSPLKNSQPWRVITNLISQQRLPHALLLVGGTLAEKQLFTDEVAKLLLCQNQSACEKSQKCQACQWVDQRTHPDLILLPAEEKENIKIDDVRALIQRLGQSAHQGNYKIAVFAPADAMPIGAMNALLKTLEEPPAQSLLLLISEHPGILPATIRSRCQRLVFAGNTEIDSQSISALTQTLELLLVQRVTPSKAAEQWQKTPLSVFLDNLYYCATSIIQQKIQQGDAVMHLFSWYDQILLLRAQLLRKLNPNHLLALENLFYQWVQHNAN